MSNVKYYFAAFIMLILAQAPLCAQGANPMYGFYDGLAEVIEDNMGSPDRCVVEAERYIEENLAPLMEAAERGRNMASGRGAEVSEEAARRALEDPEVIKAMSRGMEAMNRFMEAMQEFTMKHPMHAEQIEELLSDIGSEME